MSEIDKNAVLEKLIAMFSPASSDFLQFEAKDVVLGPNDRALWGFENRFPIAWLVEDHDFTEEEARWFIERVKFHDQQPKKVLVRST